MRTTSHRSTEIKCDICGTKFSKTQKEKDHYCNIAKNNCGPFVAYRIVKEDSVLYRYRQVVFFPNYSYFLSELAVD